MAEKKKRKRKTKREPLVAGWRELVYLPDLGIGPIVAKLDTGARSAALHADNVEVYETADGPRVRFHAFVDDLASHARECDLPLAGTRRIKNTGGQAEERLIVKTRIQLGTRHWLAEISLTDRAEMGVPMLIGRATMRRHRMMVNPGKGYILTGEERAARLSKGKNR